MKPGELTCSGGNRRRLWPLVVSCGLAVMLLMSGSAHAAGHKVKEGETLASIAELYYGHKHFQLVIAKLNQLPVPPAAPAGKTLRVPDLKVMLMAEGFPKSLEREIDDVMAGRYMFMQQRETLRKAVDPGNSKGKIIVPHSVINKLREAADILENAGKSLAKKGNFSDSATRMRQRLQACAENLRKMAGGNGDPKLDGSIHLLLAQTFVRGLMWARGEDGDF